MILLRLTIYVRMISIKAQHKALRRAIKIDQKVPKVIKIEYCKQYRILTASRIAVTTVANE